MNCERRRTVLATRHETAASNETGETAGVAMPDVNPGERLIVFLRHGIAEDRTGDKPDEERSLTQRGHARMKKGARGLRRAFPRARAIYASPLLRAVQTALWVSRAYRGRIEVHTTDALLPEASDEVMIAFIESLPEDAAILVGHEPSMSAGMMALAGVSGRPLELKKGGACAVRIGSDGQPSLEWVLSPRLLRRLSR
jgi:phosphohistidine phosphatase